MSLFGTLALAPVELLLDRLIAHDAHIAKQVERFDGKVLELVATSRHSKPITLVVVFRGATLKLNLASSAALMQTPDATLEGDISTLADLLLQPTDRRALSNPKLTVSGDAELVQSLYHLSSQLDLKWDDFLAPFIGDIATREITRVGAEAQQWRRESGAALAATVDDYLVEEGRLLPSAPEAAELRDGIDNLRLRLDRLESRLSALEATLS